MGKCNKNSSRDFGIFQDNYGENDIEIIIIIIINNNNNNNLYFLHTLKSIQ